MRGIKVWQCIRHLEEVGYLKVTPQFSDLDKQSSNECVIFDPSRLRSRHGGHEVPSEKIHSKKIQVLISQKNCPSVVGFFMRRVSMTMTFTLTNLNGGMI